MIFSSYEFLFVFLPVALLAYFVTGAAALHTQRHMLKVMVAGGLPEAEAKARAHTKFNPNRIRNLTLALAGYVFYGWIPESRQYILLMLGTTTLDWALSLVIAGDDWRIWRKWGQIEEPLPSTREGAARSRRQKWAVAISVITNLAMLGFFKYFNLAIETYIDLAQKFGTGTVEAADFIHVVLPLGISFYTFQSLSYIIDVYRGDAKGMGNFIDFACFVSMFPHLVAGPILKFSFLAEQLEHRSMTVAKFARGVAFFSLGLGKKILLANTCATVADATFRAGSVGQREAWWGAIAYSFQIFFDFSAYSDMAIGLGLMLGFVFARNFDVPYRSISVTDFWRRWHISLSTWLREYLYIPLGGNRKGPTRTYVNLLLTMLLGGLWHGASWNFVVWGALHGAALAWERWRSRWKFSLGPFITTPITFVFVLCCWVFFRSPTWDVAIDYLQAMAGLKEPSGGAALVGSLVYTPLQIGTMAVAALVVWILPDTWEWTQHLSLPKSVLCMACFWVAVLVMATQTYQPFIYFIF